MPHRNAIPRNEREAQARERALAALAAMRREELSRSAAAKAHRTSSSTMERYVGSAIRKDGKGRYRAIPHDRISRTLNFLTETGNIALKVRDSRIASSIGEHRNAIAIYERTGDLSVLAPFEGRSFRVGGVEYRFVTDPGTLDRLADADELGIEQLYLSTQGMRV
jgi:hypothetical protein